jgi:hypothetical protein
VFNDGGIVEEKNGLHDVAQAVQVGEAFQVLGNFYQGNKLVNIVVSYNEFGYGFTTSSSRAHNPKAGVDFYQIAQFGSGKANRSKRFNGELIVEIIV